MKERRCRQLRETGVAGGVGRVEPFKHLVGLLSNCVKHSDLKCAADRIPGDEILEDGVGHRSIALPLLYHGYGVVAPEPFSLQVCVSHGLLGMVLKDIQEREITVIT